MELSEYHQMMEVSLTNTNQLVECARGVSRGRVWGVFEGYGYDCVVFESVFGVHGMQCYVWIGIPVD